MPNVTVSDTLYHFTGFGGGAGKTHDEAFSTLTKILGSSVLKLNRNEISWGFKDSEGKKITGISFSPFMTCFTETPIEFADGHTRDFGKFGIGFKIDWVVRNKGQNVVYVRDGEVNDLGDAISRMLTHLSIDKLSPDFPRKWMHQVVHATENMDWRHEREWRIITDKPDIVVKFVYSDVDSIICLNSYRPKLIGFLDSDPKFVGLKEKIKSI